MSLFHSEVPNANIQLSESQVRQEWGHEPLWELQEIDACLYKGLFTKIADRLCRYLLYSFRKYTDWVAEKADLVVGPLDFDSRIDGLPRYLGETG